MRKVIKQWLIMLLVPCMVLSGLALAEPPTIEIWVGADKGPGGLTEAADDVKDWIAPPTFTFESDYLGFKYLTRSDGGLVPYYSRAIAWVVPPETGEYQFFITSAVYGRLYLSMDDNHANMEMIANMAYGWGDENSYADSWGRGSRQQSDSIYMEAGIPYAIMTTHRFDDAGWVNWDINQIGWRMPGAGEDEVVRIAEEYLVQNPDLPHSPIPANGAINVSSGQASWSEPLAYLPSQYQVWLADGDPNDTGTTIYDLGTTTDPALSLGSVGDDPAELRFGETYFWRVDATDPNELGNPVLYEGNWWSFTVRSAEPLFTQQPTSQTVLDGEMTAFTAEADGFDVPVSLTWYRINEETELVANGGFEQPPAAQGWPVNPTAGQSPVTIDGWTFEGQLWQIWMHNKTDRNIFFPDYKESIPGGDQCVVIQHGDAGGIITTSQEIDNLVDGHAYLLSFYAVSRPEVQGQFLRVELGSEEIISEFPIQVLDELGSPYNWPRYSVEFTYDQEWGNTLEFISRSSAGFGDAYFLDGVSIAPADTADFEVGTGPQLEVLGTASLDGARYYCVASSDRGNTPSNIATLTVLSGCQFPPPGDLTGDCRVGIPDLAVMVSEWMDCGWYPQDECF